MFRFCLLICIFIVLIGCQPPEKPPEPPEPGNGSHKPVQPPELEPEPKPEPNSFAFRTQNYDMLGVQESKEWLSKNCTITEIDDDTLRIQRNDVPGRVSVSKGSRYFISLSGAAIIEDDDGNMRVGFFREK